MIGENDGYKLYGSLLTKMIVSIGYSILIMLFYDMINSMYTGKKDRIASVTFVKEN